MNEIEKNVEHIYIPQEKISRSDTGEIQIETPSEQGIKQSLTALLDEEKWEYVGSLEGGLLLKRANRLLLG